MAKIKAYAREGLGWANPIPLHKKKRAAHRRSFYLFSFCEVNRSRLTDHIYFNLARIIKLFFDLFNDISEGNEGTMPAR